MPAPKTRVPAVFHAALAIAFAALLTGCGYRGPLYLPEETADEVPASESGAKQKAAPSPEEGEEDDKKENKG